MGQKVYGIDLDQEITPLMVRDAIVECFYEAHCLDAALGDAKEKAPRSYCLQVVAKSFADSGCDFENPTKEGILAALQGLKVFAANFRNPQIIAEHYDQIMQLVNKLK